MLVYPYVYVRPLRRAYTCHRARPLHEEAAEAPAARLKTSITISSTTICIMVIIIIILAVTVTILIFSKLNTNCYQNTYVPAPIAHWQRGRSTCRVSCHESPRFIRRSFVCLHRFALASRHAQHFQHLFEHIDLRQSPHAEGAKTDPPARAHL